MNAIEPDTLLEKRPEPRYPLSGTALVFRKQLRGRRFGRELLRTLGMLLPLLSVASAVLWRFVGDATVYNGNTVRFMSHWVTTELIVAALLIPIVGAVLGVGSVPATEDRESIQAILLTHITAWDIVTGRLLAALWTPICILGISIVTCLAAQRFLGVFPGDIGGLGSIAAVHCVLLAFLLMSGATAFLFALRSRPGRSWERGMLLSLSLSIVCIFALFALNSPIRIMDDPKPLIEAALLVNPVTGVCTALNKDILRVPWIYSRIEAPEYAFLYPAPSATAGVLMSIALAALVASAIRLRRSYRGDQ